jgi:hypothetical protein
MLGLLFRALRGLPNGQITLLGEAPSGMSRPW